MREIRRLAFGFVSALLLQHTVFAQDVALQPLAAEKIQKLRILSNNNIPKKVVVVQNYSTAEFVGSLIEFVKKYNLEHKDTPLKLHIIADGKWSADGLRKELQQQGILDTVVEVNDQFYTSDQWMQDWGEFAVADVEGFTEPQLTVLDSNRGRGLAGLPRIFAQMWGGQFIKNPNTDGRKGDYGGNIEVTPDNILIQGNTSSSQLRELFASRGYKDKQVILDTDWLMVGHVDEYISTVPCADAPGGYVIVKADPDLAFDLIKKATPAEIAAVHSSYRSQVQRIKDALNQESRSLRAGMNDYDLGQNNILLATRENSDATRLDQLIDLNRSISTLIDKNVETLKAAITKATGGNHKDFRVISFPGIFRGSKYSGKLSGCVALLPGVVNMLVLRNNLVIPDSLMPLLNNNISAASQALGLKANFIEDLAYHESAGQIHCGTNTVRDAATYHVKPAFFVRKSNQQEVFEKVYSKE